MLELCQCGLAPAAGHVQPHGVAVVLLLQRVVGEHRFHSLQRQLVVALRLMCRGRGLKRAPALFQQLLALQRQPFFEGLGIVEHQAVGGYAAPVGKRLIGPPAGQGGIEGADVAEHVGRQGQQVALGLHRIVSTGLAQARQLAAQVAPGRTLVKLRPQQSDHARTWQRAAAAEQDQQRQGLLDGQSLWRAIAPQRDGAEDLESQHARIMSPRRRRALRPGEEARCRGVSWSGPKPGSLPGSMGLGHIA